MADDELPDGRLDLLRTQLMNIPQAQRMGYLADLPRSRRVEFMRLLSTEDRARLNTRLSEKSAAQAPVAEPGAVVPGAKAGRGKGAAKARVARPDDDL
jgi:Mg/Co/Ni transporter MgtE